MLRRFTVIFCLLFSYASNGSQYGINLLTNPNGSDGNTGWTFIENGGNGWKATNGEGFRTSWDWAKRFQEVDLEEKGYSPELMDKQPPIVISEMFLRRWCNDRYYLKVELLNEDKDVVKLWSTGIREHDGAGCDYRGHYDKIEFILTQYGEGVRYIRWEDGGVDTEYWAGHYGPTLKNPTLAVMPVNLLEDPESLSSWDSSEGMTELAGGAVGTSHDWGSRVQEVDLIQDMGYDATTLDQGFPIMVAETFVKACHADKYYLKVNLLDAERNIIESYHSGIQTHEDNSCSYDYAERLYHIFADYGAGVRYIRWEDGGVGTEHWAGNFGTKLVNPYLGLLDKTVPLPELPAGQRHLSFLGAAVNGVVGVAFDGVSCITTLGFGCLPAILLTASVETAVVATNTYKLSVELDDTMTYQKTMYNEALDAEDYWHQAYHNITILEETHVLKNTGTASKDELVAINRYTINGDFVNVPMREGSVTEFPDVYLSKFDKSVYDAIISGLDKLRYTTRKETGDVLRGRAYTPSDFVALFGDDAPIDVPLKAFVSTTSDESVAADFLDWVGNSIPGEKVYVIMNISSTAGVDIDDLSAWGQYLCKNTDGCIKDQKEVLLTEGKFKKFLVQPAGYHDDGYPIYNVTLEEKNESLGRTIH